MPSPSHKPDYAELAITTNFTFLTGASHPEELVVRAAVLQLRALAITDRNSVAGVVRAHSALRQLSRLRDEALEQGPEVLATRARAFRDHMTGQGPNQAPDQAPIQPASQPCEKPAPIFETLPALIPGARLVLTDSPVEWLALPPDKAAWSRLTRLLSTGKTRAPKGACHLQRADLLDWGQGLILIALLPRQTTSRPPDAITISHLEEIARAFPGQGFLGAAPGYDGRDSQRFATLARLADRTGLPLTAVGDVLMHQASRRPLADVLTCIREGLTIDRIGHRRLANAERRLKSAADMARLFQDHPEAITRSLEIAARCHFSLDELSYTSPTEEKDGEEPQTRLARLTWEGLARRYPPARYPDGIPQMDREMAEHELALVGEMNYPAYFLTVHDIVAFAREKGILCQGRGSAANSILCWALGITEVTPRDISMVFERFISRHRGEPPDIDVDFEHERREEVIQHIYRRYGRNRAGLTAVVIHFRARAAIREVGKVMGLSQDVLARLSGQIWGWSSKPPDTEAIRAAGLNPDDRRLQMTIRLIGEIIGFPRHLSQHVGGFVITADRLDEICPIENAAMEDRTIIEWDKDDIDTLKILKVDVLGLGMLTCIHKAFDLLQAHRGLTQSLAGFGERDDGPTYDMLCRADAVGVFQVESRAQMNFLPRMKPRKFYDLVIEVAIVRPGPIQGGMVQPYIKRRQGKESVDYPSASLKEVLRKTLGVPLFQEQAMRIAIVGAGFSAEQADQLRRSLASFRRMGTVHVFRAPFISGMIANGYAPDFAERCFSQIEGFADYGFPESHAAAFAHLVYASAWLKCHHPAVFTCALLNSQPMGFYAPAQLVRDAREHGVEVRPVSVNHSEWDNTLERRPDGELALRLGFRQIKGMRREEAGWIAGARGNGWPDPESLWRRAGIPPALLEILAEADAFACLGLNRREALWAVKAIRAPRPLPLFGEEGEGIQEPPARLARMTEGQEVFDDYLSLRLSLRAHPMQILRPRIPSALPHERLGMAKGRVSVTGLVITRQRPGTASGVVFLTLEDETGVANIVVWRRVYEAFRKQVITGRLLRVTGRIERADGVTHLIAEGIEDLSPMLSTLAQPAPGPGETSAPPRSGAEDHRAGARHPREQAKRLFPSRDFH